MSAPRVCPTTISPLGHTYEIGICRLLLLGIEPICYFGRCSCSLVPGPSPGLSSPPPSRSGVFDFGLAKQRSSSSLPPLSLLLFTKTPYLPQLSTTSTDSSSCSSLDRTLFRSPAFSSPLFPALVSQQPTPCSTWTILNELLELLL